MSERTHGHGERATVTVCAGKDCARAHPSETAALVRRLDGAAHLQTTRCLDVCKGPVVVVEARGHETLVISRLRSGKARRDLLDLVRGRGRLTERLEVRLVRGRRRRKALARLRARPLR